jgi:hypothetical protein
MVAELDDLKQQLRQVATTGREVTFRSQHAAVLLAALERVQRLERENRELNEQLDMSAGHTAEDCEADAIQAEYEVLQRHAVRLEAALTRWHRPIAPSGLPCVCVGCEDIARLAAAPTEDERHG